MTRALLCIASLTALAGCATAPPSAAFAEPASQPAEESPSPCAGPAYRALDFWIGEWDVYTTGTDELRGRSTIASTDAGCVITERYTAVGGAYSGRSLNIYDRASGHWEQFYADSSGDLVHFVGGPAETGMQLTDEADVTEGFDEPVVSRMTLTANTDGTVRQHGEASSDAGASWETRYDLTYRPRAPTPEA